MAHPTDDKNFRLPSTIRPSRHVATLSLDLAACSFRGTQRIELLLEQPVTELVLHGLELAVSRAVFRAGALELAPEAIRAVEASETLVLTFPQPLPAGEGVLEMDWTGRFSEGLRGLYLADGVAVTQFEAADARRVFPCFDEPAFKARWALTLEVPKGLVALSNGAVVSDVEEGGRRRVTFAQTEVLSSYLVALVCGELAGTAEERTAGVPVRTWALPSKAGLARFGQEVALAVLPRLQEYFGLPYAFGKLDQVAVPNFEAGAMENAGLVTYREVALLLDPATTPLALKKRVAGIITHELAHMWFGNWVTMVWWDDLWLNEAFATWMATKVVDAWRPEWRMWLDFDAGTAMALSLDALRSTHPVRGVVRNASEAGESFDVITYEKGGAVLRMIEAFLGEAAFREGIRHYMQKHARANAVADDLWGALAQASAQPVQEVAHAWLAQSGHPLVSVTLKGNTAVLSQRRFYSEGTLSSDELWPVPVVLRFADGQGIQEQRVLLRQREEEVPLAARGKVRWLCGNAGSAGFYRVAYDEGALARLAAHLAELAPAERIGLLRDQWAIVRAGGATVGAFLDLAAGLEGEEDHAVLEAVVGRLAYIEHRLVDEADLPRFRGFVERLFHGQLARVGWEARPDEPDAVRLRRAALVQAVGSVARSSAALAEARPRVSRVLAGAPAALEPNLLDPAVGMVARAGDAAVFEQILTQLAAEKDPATRRRYLLALTAFEEPALVARAQELLFTPTVPTQDVASYVSRLLANRAGAERFWELLQRQWLQVQQRLGAAPMLLRRVVEAMGQLKERRHLEEVQAFLKAHPLEEAQQATAQTLERLSQDVALRERAMGEVHAWLERRAR